MGSADLEGWAEDFSYDYYRALIGAVRTNFELRTLSEYRPDRSPDEPVAFLRHDVDVCLERAVELAELEYELGVEATYMILPDSPLYDLEYERDLVHLIHEFGHEIALHCDLSGADPADPGGENGLVPAERRRIDAARRYLAELGIDPVASISFHRPSERVLRGPRMIDGMTNAYNPDLLAAYLSDSSGRWREGDPLESILERAGADRLQVLTHPVWWGERHAPPLERFAAVAAELDAIDTRTYEELVSIYPPYGERIDADRVLA
ncbi:polysaccharide deacetylase family protein [Natronococcus occultus]|uniref:Polysaccharide deacetylase n=1 Tax=Natronococcus occultus SP4 TaxID=694430 RepID=L0JWU8_9EURY|nr:hypothetical protein [Natronococcus occultus]AGB36303.1 hypothetical protein Natoc_0439 [Natronococcus occultus SP4]